MKSFRAAAFFAVAAVLAQALSAAAPAIDLSVDATEAPRKILHARLEIPAAPGPLTLVYPKWIPGEHGPTGPLVNLAGLKFEAGGKPIAWRRDDVDLYAIHLEVPPGAAAVDVALDFLLPSEAAGFSSAASSTSDLAVISWNQVLLYPAGRPARDIVFHARLRIPEGWKFGTALPIARMDAGEIDFEPAPLTTLVDSPVLTGQHMRVVPLAPDVTPHHEIDMAADSEAALAVSRELAGHYSSLVEEAGALFGSRHYRDYHFLLTLSDHVAHFGLEHHESSDDRLDERTLLDADKLLTSADLLPHEFVHSWNGKYRRPSGLATADYQQPMKGDLLWVYEGLTEYLGDVLAARSGLWTEKQYRENLALVAAALDHEPGRAWRPLEDTAISAQVLYGAPAEWSSWRRGTDFYPESELIWLEADTIIRRETEGKKSLDDFCRLFEGGPGGEPALKTYTFDDVVAALSRVARYDWRGFLRSHLDRTSPHAPLAGIGNAGWNLVYDGAPNQIEQADDEDDRTLNLTFSLGLVLGDDGVAVDVIPGMPAAAAGMGPGMRVVAVNGRRYSIDVLRDAIAASKQGEAPINLLVENGENFKTYTVAYHGGERHPHLARAEAKADLLDQILAPKAKH